MFINSLATFALQALVTFREGFEIALIIAMLAAILTQTGRRDQFRAVWGGVLASALLCTVSAIVAFRLVGELHGSAQMLVEAIVMIGAAGVMTWMIVWMRRHARSIKGELTGGLALATTSSAVFVFAAVAVLREGFETVMILLAAGGQSSAPLQVTLAAVVGFGAAAVLGRAVYRRGMRMDYGRFFRVTGVALIAFATYSLAYGMHELVELASPAEAVELTLGVAVPAAYLLVMLRWLLVDERRAPIARQTVAAAATAAPRPQRAVAG